MIYLDDFLFLGSKDNLNLLVSRLLDSNFMFNLKKCDITPTRGLTYLGVTVDHDKEQYSLSKRFISQLLGEIEDVHMEIISFKYKQRLVGLINFARSILALPLSTAITPPYDKIEFDELPFSRTIDHVVNSIIEKGLNLFLPDIHCKGYTPSKYKIHVQRLVDANVIKEVLSDKPKPKMLCKVFRSTGFT